MQSIGEERGLELLSLLQIIQVSPGQFVPQTERGGEAIQISSDSHFQSLIAASIRRWLGDFQTASIIVTECGIWPVQESWPLFQAVLRGCNTSLTDDPIRLFGLTFKSDESELFEGMLRLCLAFGWGGFIIKNSTSSLLQFSHDNWLRILDDSSVIQHEGELTRILQNF